MPEAHVIAARREAGVCLACGTGTPVPSRTRCEACAQAAREWSAERRERAAKAGLCEACMRRRRAKGRGNRCADCADKYLVKQLERDRARRAAAK